MSRTLVVSLFFTVFALTAVGCASEDQYCDATGCYSCDGLGCRAIDPVPTCQFNSECGVGRVCLNSECTAQCDNARPCPTGQQCDPAGYCVDEQPTECTTGNASTVCDGASCINGVCQNECNEDAECGSGRYCQAGVCVVDNRPHPACTQDSQCRYACIAGVCRTPCSSNNECQQHDVQLPFCMSGYCATSNETTSDCESQTDCNANQSCLDGVCRNN